MSNLCQTCLEPRLGSALCALNSANPVSDFVLGAAGVKMLCASHARSVCNFTDLIELGTVAAGTLMYVQDVGVPVIYNNGKWLGMDGRVFVNSSSTTLMWAWGSNTAGQLGASTTTARSSPAITADSSNAWCSISASLNTSSAVKLDGTLWTWGCNSVGQLGSGTVSNRSSPGQTCGLGTTWCQTSSGWIHTSAIKNDGTLWSWGCGTGGSLGNDSVLNASSPVTTAGGGTSWCAVSAGYCHSAAVKTDGTLWTWGSNTAGQLGNDSTTARSSPGSVTGAAATWCQVSSGCAITAAIKIDGTIWTWGCNNTGQLGNGTVITASSPGTTAGAGTTWCQSSAAGLHTTAVKTDGTVWTWGANTCGQLGDSSTVSRSSPGQTTGLGTIWCQTSTGCTHTVAAKTDGTVWTWGFNGGGQLGDGTVVNRSSPGTTAGAGTTWCAVSAGGSHTLALTVTRGI